MATRLKDNPLFKKTTSGDFGVVKLTVADIEPSPYQMRRHFDEDDIAELAESIRAIGLAQPIKVTRQGEGYHLVYGERRLRALKQLGVRELDWDSRTGLATLTETGGEADPEGRLAAQTLAENILRNDLSAIEEAEAYLTVKEKRELKTQQELADFLGLDKRRISEKVALLRLPQAIRDEMSARPDFTFKHARALLRLEDEKAQTQLFRKVVDHGLSVRETEALVEAILAGPKPRRQPKDVHGSVLRKFRSSSWRLIALMERIAEDDALRAKWLKRFGGAEGPIHRLRTGLDSCLSSGADGTAPAAAGVTSSPVEARVTCDPGERSDGIAT